jgi:hypothetical protein
MFSNRIANSARFLQMPAESQLLYFHMVLRADDDGIVESYPLLRLLGVPPDNFKILIAKGMIKPLNDDQVIVITDWTEHNTIRADRKVNSIYLPLLLEKYPELPVLEPKPRTDVEDNSARVGGQSTDGLSKVKLSKVKLSKESTATPKQGGNKVSELVEYFFSLKGWSSKDNGIVFKRYLRPAKDVLTLCEDDVQEAKFCLDKVSEWAKSRELDWTIETVIKKWYDVDALKPKDKKAYYDNCRIFQKTQGGKWYILRGGEIKELGVPLAKEQITWK